MATEVLHNAERHRYEILVDGRVVGVADYIRNGDALVFPHTEIHTSMRGKGLGAVLVRGAMEDVRSRGERVVAQCWFVAEFLEAHPEFTDLVGDR